MAKTKVRQLTEEQIAKLTEWKNAADALQAAKEKELELRLWLVVNSGIFDAKKLEGSETIEIENFPGWRISADKVMNYTVTSPEAALNVQNIIGSATGADRADIASALIKWKPELSTKAYRDVQPLVEKVQGLKEALAAAVTIKSGTPQFELLPPKDGDKQ